MRAPLAVGGKLYGLGSILIDIAILLRACSDYVTYSSKLCFICDMKTQLGSNEQSISLRGQNFYRTCRRQGKQITCHRLLASAAGRNQGADRGQRARSQRRGKRRRLFSPKSPTSYSVLFASGTQQRTQWQCLSTFPFFLSIFGRGRAGQHCTL